jgi:hypothetical protein
MVRHEVMSTSLLELQTGWLDGIRSAAAAAKDIV